MTKAGHFFLCMLLCPMGAAQNMKPGAMDREYNSQGESPQSETAPPATLWEYGGFIDAAYLLDFNHPANDLFRSRGTAYKASEPLINMTVICRKQPQSLPDGECS